MDTKTTKLIGELAARCITMNCDTLHVFFNYSGHVDDLTIKHHLGGWTEESTPTDLYSRYLRRGDGDIASLKLAHASLDNLEAEHDKLYAPENLAATQEAARLAKIADLQKQIEELENKDERFLNQAQGRSVRNNAGELS